MKRVWVAITLVIACSQPPSRDLQGPRAAPQRLAGALTISIIGTNDLHGALERLPLFAGYVANLRAARAADRRRGRAARRRRHVPGHARVEPRPRAPTSSARTTQIGYTAVAVGNHEFDFGPEGPAVDAALGRGRRARRAQGARERRRSSRSSSRTSPTTRAATRIKWPNMPAVDAGRGRGRQGRHHRREHRGDAVHDDAGELRRARDAAADRGRDRRRGQAAARAGRPADRRDRAHRQPRASTSINPNDISSCDTRRGAVQADRGAAEGHGRRDRRRPHPRGDRAPDQRHRGDRVVLVGPRVRARRPAGQPRRARDLGQDPPAADAVRGRGRRQPDAGRRPASRATTRASRSSPDPAVQAIVDEALATRGRPRDEKLGVTLTATVTQGVRHRVRGGQLVHAI